MRFCNFYKPETLAECLGLLHQGNVYSVADLYEATDALDMDSPYPIPLEKLTDEERNEFELQRIMNEGLSDINIPDIAEIMLDVAAVRPKAYKMVEAFKPADVVFLPPLLAPLRFRDFYAFEKHVLAARAKRGLAMEPAWYEFPAFYYSNHDPFHAHREEVVLPKYGRWLDFELEIACLISEGGVDIPVEEAEQHIAGYSILNDWSLRDVQLKEMRIGLGPSKSKDFATSMGPYLVTPDELESRRAGKGYDCAMIARVNGREVSRGNWRDIHWSFAEMIAHASQDVVVFPGDVLGSGTVGTGCLLEIGTRHPDGAPIGSGEDGWLGPGDEVELEVEGLGMLRNRIVAERSLLPE